MLECVLRDTIRPRPNPLDGGATLPPFSMTLTAVQLKRLDFHLYLNRAFSLVRAVAKFTGWVIGFLLATTVRERDVGTIAAYGALNSRTNTLDDGTDPIGWYD
jgi:hypothetical protein